MKRIAVCGGRDYGRLDPRRIAEHPRRRVERKFLRDVLSDLAKKLGPFQMIHGGASGADALAGDWADDRAAEGFPTPIEFPAFWKDVAVPGAVVREGRNGPYNLIAGFQRNQRIVDEGAVDLLVAFPGGGGTADMIERARKAGIEVLVADEVYCLPGRPVGRV